MQETARQVVNTRYNIHTPFVLAVGVLQPRKNLRMLAQAFGRAKAAYGLPHSSYWQANPDGIRSRKPCGRRLSQVGA